MRHKAYTPNSFFFLMLLLSALAFGAVSILNKVFYPISSNMGLMTDYYMAFSPDQSYTVADLNLRLTVPLQFQLSQIENYLQCHISRTGLANSYQKMPKQNCYAQPNTNSSFSIIGDIIIKINSISSTAPLHFVLRNIKNPTTDTSSFFSLCIRSGTHLLECDRQFMMLAFTPSFIASNSSLSIQTNPSFPVVGQGTTYEFKIKSNIPALTASYNLDAENVQIRVVFPKQYYSSRPICSLLQYSNATGTFSTRQTQTTLTPSKQFSVECTKIQNFISSYLYFNGTSGFHELTIRIQNIENPVSIMTFTNIEIFIIRGGRNQILEKINLAQPITISAEKLQGQVKQTNLMRNATNQYFFYMTHDLTYGLNSKIVIKLGSGSLWHVHDAKLMFGFTNSSNSTSTVKNTATQSIIEIKDYGIASKQVQQIIAINLTSTDVIGDHPVRLQTYINDVLSGEWYGIVKLNSTWGSFNRLSFSAVQYPTKLPVGQTGPLQFTLFLNYELPQSQNIENGSMIIKMIPPIPTPDPDIYGQVKCYFKATKQAANCTYDNNDPSFTKISLVSPPYQEFQYSQIPIIITTQGGIDEDHLGFTISPIVERYKFDVEFFLYNSSSIPSEVLYTNWVADAIQLPGTLTGVSICREADQWTSLHFTLIPPLMNSTQQRLQFQFLKDQFGNTAWDNELGYNTDEIIKEFPCVIQGLIGNRIKCDLYTYVDTKGPYNKQHVGSRYFGPLIMIYGFETPVATGVPFDIYLPGIKLSTTVGAKALVSFSILQQTPGQTQPYLELYHQNIVLFTSVPFSNVVTTSQTEITPIQVQTLNPYLITWNPVNNANVAYIKYDLTKKLPSIDTLYGTCAGSTCYSSGYPNNWIVQIPTGGPAGAGGLPGAVSSSFTMTTSINIESMAYVDTLIDPQPVRITTYDVNGRTLQRINIVYNYIPQPMMSGSFNLLDTTIYAGLKQWYMITFDSSSAVTSSYPFVRLRLRNDLKFARPEQCESTLILPFNQSGIICSIAPGTSDRQMIVWNIQNIVSSSSYSIKVRLLTQLSDYTMPIVPQVDIFVNHNQSLVDSLVQQIQNVLLPPFIAPQMAKPEQFTIHNPQILNQQIRVDYIGRIFIDFESTLAMSNTKFKIVFMSHRYNLGIWKTPNQLDTDPVVCMLNGIRYYCNPTHTLDLQIMIPSTVIKLGTNRLQIDTEYIAPYNGLVFPNCAGNYQIRMSTINPTTLVETTQHTFYAYIHPPSLEDIQVESIVKDINTESVYLVNFTINDAIATPLGYDDPANYTRIFIEFPTIVNGQRVFLDNLGGYQGVLNQRVGCAFLSGANYVTMISATQLLQCRLIPPQIPGAPVKVEVINFTPFTSTVDSLGLFIFKVFNPAIAFNSVQIKVKINQYHVPTGQVYPVFQSDFVVFLDPRPENTNILNFDSGSANNTDFFEPGKDVGDYGYVQINAHAVTATTILPFYMLVKLPKYLPVQNQQLAPAFVSCPPTNFQYCVSSPDVNYVLVKGIVNGSFFQVNIKDFPIGISQDDSFFYSMVIEQGRYAGNIEYVITANKRWIDIGGNITFNYAVPVGLLQKAVVGKEHFQIQISFDIQNYLPETGTVEISFPSAVTKIYPFCRSVFTKASALVAKSGATGEIGCDVQFTAGQNRWIITGFQEILTVPATIIISGFIDLPATSTPVGPEKIITYADTHQTNIFNNGSRIDYVDGGLTILPDNTLAMNANEGIFLSQRDVVRANDIGEFRLLIKPAQLYTTAGYIRLDFMKKDINNKIGGFSFTSDKKVCEIIQTSTQDRIGCQVTVQQQLPVTPPAQYIRYTLKIFQNLVDTKTYQLRLTTQKYSYPSPQGIAYPTVPSTYKIDVEMRHTASSVATIQHLYMDVYGPQFTQLKVTQHNYIQSHYNVYWFEIKPAVTILTDHQIIIEFPTRSNDGTTRLFTDNLGLIEYRNGDLVMTDIFDTTVGGLPMNNDFIKCNIFHGDYSTGMPVKIVCGQFLYQIATADILRFALSNYNPPLTGAQLSIPLMVYSYDPQIFTKTNFNLANGAGYVNEVSNYLTVSSFTATTSGQMEYPNDDFLIGSAHSFDLLPGDAYLIKFGFPLRVNDKQLNQCIDLRTALPCGDAYYHQRLRTVICKITVLVANQLAPAAVSLSIPGFYTPWYYLQAVQTDLYAVAHYYSTTNSQVIRYIARAFPLLVPRFQFSAPLVSSLVLTPILAHSTLCQRNDYVFTIKLDSGGSGAFNLQYTRLISITFPLQALYDYQIFGRDCVQHTSSEIQVKLCEINKLQRTIYIQILPGIHSNDKIIAIQTKGLAIRNPCVNASHDINEFTVNFRSWENITVLDRRGSHVVYMTMGGPSLNMALSMLTYSPEASTGANTFFYPFEWVEIPHQRRFTQFHQFQINQYSPFKFDLLLTTAIAAQTIGTGTYNTLTLFYGDKFDVPLPEDNFVLFTDLKFNTELCYLRNTRVARCQNNYALKKITMQFEFALPTTQWINVYFSIQDPRNLQINGFQYIGTDSDLSANVYLQLQQFSTTPSQIFKPPPFQARQTNVNIALTQMPQRAIIAGSINYATSLTSQLNVIDITLTFNVTGVRGLKFEIPQMDQFGVQIFSNPTVAFMDLKDGDQYPCGNNDDHDANTGKAKCYLFYGSNTIIGGTPLPGTPGQPVSIIMTDFTYTTRVKARFLMKNPAAIDKWVTINVKAYSGPIGPSGVNALIGHKYVGYWRFPNIFKTVDSAAGLTASGHTATVAELYPANPLLGGSYIFSNPLWMDSTNWMVTGTVPAFAVAPTIVATLNEYVIFEGYLNDFDGGFTAGEQQLCQVDWTTGNLNSDDMIIYRPRHLKQQRVFFIKQWDGVLWPIQYYKCKHYTKTINVYYHSSKITQNIITYTMPFHSYLLHSLSQIRYYEVMMTRTYIEIDLSLAMVEAIARGLNWENQVDYYLVLTTNAFLPWTGFTTCQAVGGFINNEGQAVGCSQLTTNSLRIDKFNEIIKTAANKYIIRLDIKHAIATSVATPTSITISVRMYAGLDSFNNGLQYMLNVDSIPYIARQFHQWPSQAVYYTTGYSGLTFYTSVFPPWTPTAWSNIVTDNIVSVRLTHFELTPTLLSFTAILNPTQLISIDLYDYTAFQLRFLFEGVSFACGSGNSMTGSMNGGPQQDLTLGVICSGSLTKNYVIYSGQTHSNLAGSARQMKTLWVNGLNWDIGEVLTIRGFVNVNTVKDTSNTRDWVGIKVFAQTSSYQTTSYTYCDTFAPFTCYTYYYNDIYSYYKGSGEAFYQRTTLFSGATVGGNFQTVTLTALSNLINHPTQLQIAMYAATTAFGPSTDKLLLLQLNTNLQDMFPYLNNTAVLRNQRIECTCFTSGQPTFIPASPFFDLDCYLKLPQGLYGNTAISVNVDVLLNNYVKCFFPGFMLTANRALKVTTKLINEGTNMMNYPNADTEYGGLYKTSSNVYNFVTGSILNAAVAVQTPDVYATGAAPFAIGTTYSGGVYSLDVNMSTLLTQPIFYIDFQKAGPIPDYSLCSAYSGSFSFCRLYSRFRNIIVAKMLVDSSTCRFAIPSALHPLAKQPGAEYDLKVYVKQPAQTQYTYMHIKPRASPINLVPTTTNFNVYPDRLTSLDYPGMTSNIILSFYLQGHAFTSFYEQEAKIQISYAPLSYITARKGCTVSTDDILHDSMFSFYCQVDPSTQIIKIHNRYFNRDFSAGSTIQVVVGVNNQASTVPATFTLKMYKWYYSPTNYGLLIQKQVMYTPTSLLATQSLQLVGQIKQYPFYTTYYSDDYAPFRMGFKFPSNMTIPLSYTLDLTTFMILEDFYGLLSAFTSYECYLKQFTSNPPAPNIQILQTNGYRNYKQNTQYYFVPTYCSLINATGLRIQIPRNRDLQGVSYYELVVMPINAVQTGFDNNIDLLAKLVVFPAPNSEHIFGLMPWTQNAFTLTELYIVTTRPMQPTALLLKFSTTFASSNDFPDHYIEIVFNNLNLNSILLAYRQLGYTVPCTLSAAFTNSATFQLLPNCIVTYADMKHEVIKIRVENFNSFVATSFQLTFDYFFLPDLTLLLQASNTFTVCMNYWSATIVHQRCFGQLFIIDGYINTAAINSLSSTFTNALQKRHGLTVSPTISLPYPKTSTGAPDQKVMIQIKGGFSATKPAPLTFGGSSVLWHNAMLGLYIRKQSSVTVATPHLVTLSGMINPFPYQMEEYMSVNNVDIRYYSGYHPHSQYLVIQTPYSYFIPNDPKVAITASGFSQDVKTSVKSGTQVLVKMTVTIQAGYGPSVQTIHENDRFQLTFSAAVTKVKRCWVTTPNNIEYSKTTICTPKPNSPATNPKKLQLLNFHKSNTNFNPTIYAVLQVVSSPISITSELFARNNQLEFTATVSVNVLSLSVAMVGFTELTFTESHYMPGYFEQIIKPVSRSTIVQMMYLSLMMPSTMIFQSSIFRFIPNTTLTIVPTNWTTNTRLVCEWMRVTKYGRQYQTGKYSPCKFVTPGIQILAPTWNLPHMDGVNRIQYLLKIRQESPTASTFTYPLTSQAEQILLELQSGGAFQRDTLTIHPYQHFNGLSIKHTTLSDNGLNTYHVEFATPTVPVGAGQYVLSLDIDSKYMPDTMGVKDIYNSYGEDQDNRTIVNGLGLNMIYTSLPHKWINGIPYSCWTLPTFPAENTCVLRSQKIVRINLLLATYGAALIWKIPLLLNPVTKPLRMNLTLWSYPSALTAQGHKELFYEIINQHVTKPTSPPTVVYDIQTNAKLNNKIQTSTNSLNIEFATYVPITNDVIEVKLLPRTVGLIDIPSLWSPAFMDPTYDFYFFKNINFLIAKRNAAAGTSRVINMGAVQVSNDFADLYGYSWLKIHSATTMLTTRTGSAVSGNMPECQIASISFLLKSGADDVRNSKFEIQFYFTTPCLIPINSTLKLTADVNDLTFLPKNDEAYCETNFRSSGCWLDAAQNLYVRIDEALAINAPLEITTFAKSKSRTTIRPLQGSIYAIPQLPTTLVNTLAVTNMFPITKTSNLDFGSVFQLLIKPLYENAYSKLTGTFTPAHDTTFTFINLVSPFSRITTSNQTFYYQLNTSALTPYFLGSQYAINEQNSNNKWMRTQTTASTNFVSNQLILPGGINSYAINKFRQYWFVSGSMYETSGDLNNYFVGPVGQYYQFEYRTDEEIAYHEVYTVPIAENIIVHNPLTQVGQQTVIGIQFQAQFQDIYIGDRIQIQLDAHNLIQNMYTFTDEAMQCIQFVNGILTSNPELICQVTQYPNSALNIPLKIHVFPTNNVTMNTPINIWISPVINSVNLLVAGVTIKVLRSCGGQKLCTMYEGRGWYRTTSSLAVAAHGIGDGTFLPAPTTVLQPNAQHTYNFFPIDLETAFIKYPQNYKTIMPLNCAVAGGTCLIFPKQRKVVTVTPPAVGITSLLVTGLTNGIYVLPQMLIDLKVASSTNLDKYPVYHDYLTTRQVMPDNAMAPNTFVITNTQNSGQIYLRNYWNTVKMEIDGLYTSKFIKAFYIIAPAEVTEWDQQYCNATIQSPDHNPYPYRLQCALINTTTIQIKISQGVQYIQGISQLQTLTVHAKFWLTDFLPSQGILYVSNPVPSGDFNAYGSFSFLDQNASFFITQAFLSIPISQHRTPLISQVAFNTESYQQRLASVNDQTIFQILFDPLTTLPIDYIELVIPEQFSYPTLQYHDMCQLIYRRILDIPSCKQIRKDNQTIIMMDIDETLYDNGPRILQVGSRNMTNWFTAPGMPGWLYNMTISLYGTDGKLLEKQSTKNSSRIKGYDLQLNQIVVQNGQDQEQEQIYDITFKVGNVGVKQGYRGILANKQYYSQIKIKFQTFEGYQYLLGGYYSDGDRVGCVTSLQSINKQISCVFDMGTNINDEPALIITNYEQVLPGATVRISLANIKNLPSTLRNTLSIEVKYYRVDDMTQLKMQSYNMYEPTQAITDATSAFAYSAFNTLIVSYPAQTIVNQPVTFQIVINPSVTITDYIVVKFPKYGLRDDYTRFNNIQCAQCAKFEIFYRAQVIRIYPLGGVHTAGTTLTYIFTGFPSTQYVIIDPLYAITVEGFSSLKVVNHQIAVTALSMKGCKINSGIIGSTSPYSGDTGVSYTFEAQVNSSQLNRLNQPKQLTMQIKLPASSEWFSPSSYCIVQLPLICNIDTIQKRLVIKNLLLYTKPTVTIKVFNLLNPPMIVNQTKLTFTTTLFEQSLVASATPQQQNTICIGYFDFMYLPSPPNKCSLSVKSEHQSTIKENLIEFSVVCEEAIKNSTYLYIMIPREMTFNNPVSNIYKCWADTPSILLDSSCRIIYLDGLYYLKTIAQLNIDSNVLQISLKVTLNNPLVANTYVFGSTLEHSGNFYSVTNNISMSFYTATTQSPLNTSLSLQAIPKQAGAQAIYVVRVPTQILNDKMQLNFGLLGISIDSSTKISYYQSSNESTSTNITTWFDQQNYFSLLQQSYSNNLNFSLSQMSDLSQNIMIDTQNIPSLLNGWTYVILSPVINPSSSNATDALSLKIFDTVNSATQSYDTLKSIHSITMNLTIQNAPNNIYQTQYSVKDNDILSMTQHTITFTLDHQLFANQNGAQNLEFIIDPPTGSLKYLKEVQMCLYYPDITILIECQNVIIGEKQLLFKPQTTNLTIALQTSFILEIKNISNPENETTCNPKLATEKDYMQSYFELKIIMNKQLKYQSVFVGMIDDSNKPCVEFKSKKGDILNNLPEFIYAGFEESFNITVTQSTANLRVMISSNDSDVIFSPNLIYFNEYRVMSKHIKAIVSNNAVNKPVEIRITRDETMGMSTFREPAPFIVKIIAGKKQTVTVYEMQSPSVGYDIKIPIELSRPSVNDMTFIIAPQNSTAMAPYMKFFTFSSLQFIIPALSSMSSFTVRYNGTKIPPTLNLTLRLISQNTLTHYLLKQIIYLYFSIDAKYQTLPPVMKMDLQWLFRSNKDQQTRLIYYCCDSTKEKLSYDYLKPFIIDKKVVNLTATKASVQVWTRNQATLYYQLRQRGQHFQLQKVKTEALRLHSQSLNNLTIRNSTKIINAYQLLNFTNLEHDTEYYLYVSAFDAFGDSENVTLVTFKTNPLSTAIKFNLNSFQILTDEVAIVRALADILQIDMRRIKVVSSEQNLLNTFSLSTQNRPVYAHEIVISPSIIDDSMATNQLFTTRMLNSPANQALLKQKIPSWTGNFDPISKHQSKKQFYQVNRVRAQFKQAPKAQRLSYYNATLNVKLWAKARVSAVILVEERKTPQDTMSFASTPPVARKLSSLSQKQRMLSPNSKQIIKGLTQYNQKLDAKYTFSGLTDQQGSGVVFFKGLKPGSACKVYITATNPQDFQPVTSLGVNDAQVYMMEFNLLWNPNLKGNQHLMLQELKKSNEKMYEVINEYYKNQDSNNGKTPVNGRARTNRLLQMNSE